MIRVYYYSTLVVMLPHSKSVKVRVLTFIVVYSVMLVNIVARSRGSYRHQSWFQMLNRHVEKCAVEEQSRTNVVLSTWNVRVVLEQHSQANSLLLSS